MSASHASICKTQSPSDFSQPPLKLRIEIGGVSLTPAELAGLEGGEVVALEQSIEEPVEVYSGDRLVARGQIVVIEDEYCIQLDEVFGERLHA